MALPVYGWILILVAAFVLLALVPGGLKIAVIVVVILLLIVFVPWGSLFNKGNTTTTMIGNHGGGTSF